MTVLVIAAGGYAADGSAIVGAGTAPALLAQLTQPNPPGPDIPQALAGRSFVQRVLATDGSVAVEVDGVIQPAAGELLFSLPGAPLAALLPSGVGQIVLTHALVERVTGGEVLLLSRPFAVSTALGAGAGQVRIVTAAGAVAVGPADDILSIQAPAAVTVDLPAAPAPGRALSVKDGAGTAAQAPITLVPAGGTIDGEAQYVLAAAYQSVTLVWDGAQWAIT